ncbi:UDP-glucose 4-epimerase, partial [Mammaliicoccus sciuri]
VKEAIQEYYPNFTLDYDVDPIRQGIANSWPDSIDTNCSRGEWGFDPKYDLASMTQLMLEAIEQKDTVKNNN